MPLFVVIIIVPPLSVFTVVVCGSVCVCVFVGGSPALSPALREPLLPEWD